MMQAPQDIEVRFGSDAAAVVAPRIGTPPIGDPVRSPAAADRVRGSLVGAAIGDALGEPVEDRSRRWIAERCGDVRGYLVPSPATSSDTLLTLITADSLLADPVDHPTRLAARLHGVDVPTRGRSMKHARTELLAGRAWWQAAMPRSAGTAGAARCASFGLLWAGDPRRAAYEAALSTSVTHGHPVATTAAAAFAAAVALAARGDGPLDGAWIEAVTEIAAGFEQGAVPGKTVVDRLRVLPALIGQPAESVRAIVGTGAIAIEAVPAALWCATAHADPVEGVVAAVSAGGDTDTIAAMAGACLGARNGEAAWPSNLTNLAGLDEVRVVADRISIHTANGPDASASMPATDATGTPVDGVTGDVPVHVSFLIDRSGSMSGLEGDVVGGFNAFVDGQRKEPGVCRLTAVQFDGQNAYEVLRDAVEIDAVADLRLLEYQPRGRTPQFAALGNLIRAAEGRLATLGTAEDQIVVVFTDGHENASRSWTRQALFDLVEAKKREGWTFVFMGANQDAYATGGGMGFDPGSTQNYRGDGIGTRSSWDSVNMAVTGFRSSAWEEKQRRKADFFAGQKDAEVDDLNR